MRPATTHTTNSLTAYLAYRFHFNGKETDVEVYGEGNLYDYGERIYNPRIGRWFSTDRLQTYYPEFSPYNYSLNNPVTLNDPNGEWVKRTVKRYDKNGELIPVWKFWVEAKTIEISLVVHNVKIYNGSSTYATPDAMRKAADDLKKQIETNLTHEQLNRRGQIIKTIVKIEGQIEIIKNLDKVKSKGPEKDNLIYIIDRNVIEGANGLAPRGSDLMFLTPEAAGLVADKTEYNSTKNTATHEFGHVLGLKHNDNISSVMYKESSIYRGSKLLPRESKKLATSMLDMDYKESLEKYDSKQKEIKQ